MEKNIDTLSELRMELESMFIGISSYCFHCTYKCCQGFINVLPREIDGLVENDIEIVAINENVYFLNNFDLDQNGVPKLDVFAPLCRLRGCDKRCKINKFKPIVCSLYPIIPDIVEDGSLAWALHMDCAYSNMLKEEDRIEEIKERFIEILTRVTPPLYDEIKESFENVSSICSFPIGYNKTIKVKEV